MNRLRIFFPFGGNWHIIAKKFSHRPFTQYFSNGGEMKMLSCRKRFSAAAVIMSLLFLLFAGGSHAEDSRIAAVIPASGEDQDFQAWLEILRREARKEGISEATLDASLIGISPVMRVIELDRSQPEFTQTFWDYLDRRVTEDRVRRGRELLGKHRELLDGIYRQYGIPPRYIMAFWGLETNYGGYMGSFRVIDVLATLAYNPRRAAFFRAELLEALRIVDQGHITPNQMKGSWAGAMGHMQFMPSTFRRHARDYTGNGRKDIWNSLPDAFASGAGFLSDIGWRKEERWGREVLLPDDFDLRLAGMHMKKTVTAWGDLGVRQADGALLPDMETEGSVILPQGRKGPAFLVYDNFRVIMGWNRSIYYAITVGHLADRITGLPGIINGRDAAHTPLSRTDIKTIQAHLNRLGFDVGPEDGIAGARTNTAIRRFQEAQGLPPDGYASPDLLEHLQKAAKD
jgi:membrane-bound lytic murein transglycosylase B